MLKKPEIFELCKMLIDNTKICIHAKNLKLDYLFNQSPITTNNYQCLLIDSYTYKTYKLEFLNNN